MNNAGKLLTLLVIFFIVMISCERSSYIRTDRGVLINFKGNKKSECQMLQVEFISDRIVHVTASPDKNMPSKNSLVIVEKAGKAPVKWDLTEAGNEIIIKTSALNISISKKTGEIKFKDNDGNIILQELEGGGKSFEVQNTDNTGDYKVRQIFDSPADEAFYGLGQHQNGELNYKGLNVDLTQYNTVAVVPFLISSKNYGILWDNYSRTKFSDPREYKELSEFTLYNKNGEKGGITASYYKEKKDQLPVTIEERKISYKYLDDLLTLPKEFSLEKGKVEWEGYIESEFSGRHFFELFCSGYTKAWIDNKKVVDTWRQQWNPWKKKFEYSLEKGKKYKIKIEWIPDGSEAYIGLNWLEALPDNNKQLSLSSESGHAIDYYFIYGDNFDDIISGYREISGKAPIVPEWALGFWQSRERYKTQNEVLDVVKEFRKRNIPLDNIVIDWQYWVEDGWGDHEFDRNRFPDPEGMLEELHNNNTHVMISVWPKFYVGTKNYKVMDSCGFLYKENIKNKQKDWVGPGYVSTFYDAFNKEARDIFWNDIDKKLYRKGIDAWWMDATEPDILSNSSIENRKKLMGPTSLGPSTTYFNAYSIMNAKGIYEGQRSAEPDKRIFILTRSAFAGQQRYAAATWSGDIVSTWDDLRLQIPAGLNFSMSGIPYWTMDIGGFSLEKRFENPKGNDLEEWRELNTRWHQFGAFCPLFRSHGQYPYREIFNIAPKNHVAYQSMLYYNKLRYRLMPYIYSLAGITYHNNYTIMRALMMDFPYDNSVRNISDQYMFGTAMMVCPVYEYKAETREVYLPSGANWYNFYTGESIQGGKTIIANAPLNEIPVFIKEGSIIPFGPEIQYTGEKPSNPITLVIYDGKDGEFDLYEDEGINYNYEKGIYSIIPVKYSSSEKTITFGKRQGEFISMLKERKFKIILISTDNMLGYDSLKNKGRTVTYNGSELILKL